jgi:hypothetical protein
VIEGAAEAIRVSRLSGVDLRQFDVKGLISGDVKSLVDLRNGTVDGDIRLRRDTDIIVRDRDGPVTITGNVDCEDKSSTGSFAPMMQVLGSIKCGKF